MSITIGNPVAFLQKGTIQFGILIAVNNRKTRDGETSKYEVRHVIHCEVMGKPTSVEQTVVIESEDDLIDVEYPPLARLYELMEKSANYEWAKAESKRRQEPDEPKIPPVDVAQAFVPLTGADLIDDLTAAAKVDDMPL